MGRLTELQREAEWRHCSESEPYFLRNYWNIAHPAHGRILFNLRGAQSSALQHWDDNRYSLTLKARQIGWTTLVAAHHFGRGVVGNSRVIPRAPARGGVALGYGGLVRGGDG